MLQHLSYSWGATVINAKIQVLKGKIHLSEFNSIWAMRFLPLKNESLTYKNMMVSVCTNTLKLAAVLAVVSSACLRMIRKRQSWLDQITLPESDKLKMFRVALHRCTFARTLQSDSKCVVRTQNILLALVLYSTGELNQILISMHSTHQNDGFESDAGWIWKHGHSEAFR